MFSEGSYFSYQATVSSDIAFVSVDGKSRRAEFDVYAPFQIDWSHAGEKITALFLANSEQQIEDKIQTLVSSILPRRYTSEIIYLKFGPREDFGSITHMSFYAHSKKRDNDLMFIRVPSKRMVFKIKLKAN